jgi:hypothetical protein
MANWLDKYEQGGLVLKKKTKDNYGKKANPNDVQASVGPDFVGLGYNTKGRNYSPAWGGQFQNGGFLQPNSSKLPEGYVIPYNTPSTELAMSIGGEEGEPAYLIPSFKGGKKLKDPIAEYKKTGEHLGGPFKTWQEAEKFGEMRHEYVEKGQSLPSPLKWWDDMQMGGALPGATGMMYARYSGGGSMPGDADYNAPRKAGSAPANGKYTKKTKASAQNGQEMKFYQEGLDFKPKTISQNGSVIKDDRGQWAHPGEITEIDSNDITMQGVDYPVLGVSDTGDTQMMYPDQDYKFDGEKVTEFPMAQKGKTIQPTLQDSLALYNNSKQVQDYYDKKKQYKKDTKDFFHTNEESTLEFVHGENNKDLESFRRRGNARVPLTKGKGAKSMDLPESIYYRKLDDNKYLQREAANAILDTRAPMQLFDKRIAPTKGSGYMNVDESDPLFGDALSINTYDPVLVKPVSMLTPEEMKLRLKRYGKNSGIKETVTKPTQKSVSKPTTKSTPKPEPKPELAPVVTKQPIPQQPTPQPKPLYEYEGESVMAQTPGGGGGAMVGVRKKDGTVEYIRPEDYQRMGVPKYGQDYIKSKQKMKDGGWLNKYK